MDRDTIKRRLSRVAILSGQSDAIVDEVEKLLSEQAAPAAIDTDPFKESGDDAYQRGWQDGRDEALKGIQGGEPVKLPSIYEGVYTDGARAGRDEVLKHLRDKADGMGGGPIKGALAKIVESVETWPLPKPEKVEFANSTDEQKTAIAELTQEAQDQGFYDDALFARFKEQLDASGNAWEDELEVWLDIQGYDVETSERLKKEFARRIIGDPPSA